MVVCVFVECVGCQVGCLVGWLGVKKEENDENEKNDDNHENYNENDKNDRKERSPQPRKKKATNKLFT